MGRISRDTSAEPRHVESNDLVHTVSPQWRLTAVTVQWIELDRSDVTVREVHRTGELEKIAAAAATDLNGSDHPVVTAGVVVNRGSAENDVGPPEAVESLLTDAILANADGLLGREPARRAIPVMVTVTRKTIAVTREAIPATLKATPVTGNDIPAAGKSVSGLALWRGALAVVAGAGACPDQVEGVAFRAAVPILNPHHGSAAIARIPDQILRAPAVDSLEPEVRRIIRHPAGTFEAAPLRRLAGDSPQDGTVAANFHFGDGIHDNLNGALAFVGAFATLKRGSA